MAERGTVWVPTFSPLANLVLRPELMHKGADMAVIRRTVAEHARQLVYAEACGVSIALGTDAGAVGVEHGVSAFDEFEHMVEAGLPRKRVLEIACSAGRVLADRGDALCPWCEGDPFDAVIVTDDPLDTPLSQRSIVAVYPPKPTR